MRIFVPVEDAPCGDQVALLVPYQCGLVREKAMRQARLSEMWAQFAMMDAGWNRLQGRTAANPATSSQGVESR